MPRAKTQQETESVEVSAETMAQGTDVAAAGVEAAHNEPDPAKRPAAASAAIQEAAQQQGWELSDEDCSRIGSAVVAQLEMRGAFEPPPAAVQAPAAPTGAGTAPAQPEVEQPPLAPQKTSFAERFRRGNSG